ncbi:hypothetical protein J2P12_00015 [Candidatus Bathyarchaeota archaeon]|nr:hypothetical protein [Candidatus Bathyarchaeota archaeon]
MGKTREPPYYQPTQTDIDWARSMMTMLSDGGTLAYPATRLIYRIDHKKKTLTLANPDQLFHFPSFVIHYQTIDVFHQIGYTVLPPKETNRE